MKGMKVLFNRVNSLTIRVNRIKWKRTLEEMQLEKEKIMSKSREDYIQHLTNVQRAKSEYLVKEEEVLRLQQELHWHQNHIKSLETLLVEVKHEMENRTQSAELWEKNTQSLQEQLHELEK